MAALPSGLSAINGGPGLSTPVITPGKYPLQLGAITFSSEETPEQLNIGAGGQMLVVDSLPGGGRVVYDMGNEAADISWDGRLFGPNIAARVQQLRAYRISGQAQVLSFKNERYLVKIKDFDPGYRGKFNNYRMTLVVIKDLNGAFTVASSASVDQQVAALQAQAQTLDLQVQQFDDSPPYESSLTALAATIAQFTPLVSLAIPGASSILNAVDTAVAAVGSYQDSLAAGAPQTPAVIALAGTLTAIGLNVTNAQTSTIQTVVGGDCFAVAALQYGDVTQAFNIAAASGLPYPLLPTNVETPLVIPPLQSQ